MKASVIGSYRSSEKEIYKYEKISNFFLACRYLGVLLAENKYELVIGWSNENLPDQFMGGKYIFEDTADYNTMIGYLAYVVDKLETNQPISEYKVHLFISDEVLNGTSLGNPLSPRRYQEVLTGHQLQFFIQKEIISLKTIPGDLKSNLLRSTIISNIVLPYSDLALTIGGGKATRLSIVKDSGVPENRLKSFPVPIFGGSSKEIFETLKADLKTNNSSYLTQELGARVDAILRRVNTNFNSYDDVNILITLREIIRCLGVFYMKPYKVFVAMPFAKSKEIGGYISDDVYYAIKNVGKRLREKFEQTEIYRVDGELGQSDSIPDLIHKNIQDSGVLIADLTPVDGVVNANVYYELGYAKGLHKKIILIAKEGTKTPFDVTVYRTLFYDTYSSLENKLFDNIEKIFEDYRKIDT